MFIDGSTFQLFHLGILDCGISLRRWSNMELCHGSHDWGAPHFRWSTLCSKHQFNTDIFDIFNILNSQLFWQGKKYLKISVFECLTLFNMFKRNSRFAFADVRPSCWGTGRIQKDALQTGAGGQRVPQNHQQLGMCYGVLGWFFNDERIWEQLSR